MFQLHDYRNQGMGDIQRLMAGRKTDFEMSSMGCIRARPSSKEKSSCALDREEIDETS